MAALFSLVWSVAAFVVGAWIGLMLPDVDQRTDLLLHRSIITHGPLIPLIVFLLVRNARHLTVRVLPMSLCLGFVVHLAFDLFPRAWSGYALISFPVYGWLPPVVSIMWIAATALLCAYWGARLVRGLFEWAGVLIGAVGIFAYAAPGEASLIGPLIALLVCLAIGVAASTFLGLEKSGEHDGVLSY